MKTSKKPAKPVEQFSLASERTKPVERIGDCPILLYGEKKIGKTSLASEFPDSYFLLCEPGGRGLSLYATNVTSWATFKLAVKALKDDKRFKTVVIDTVDEAYRFCLDAVCKEMGIDHPSDEGYGKGWAAVKNAFAKEVNSLLRNGKGIIFISHAMEQEVETRKGKKYHKISPTMPKAAREMMEALVDIWCYYTYEDGTRTLHIRGDDHIGAGTRLGNHFLSPNGSQLTTIPMGGSSKEAFNNFTSAFNNKLAGVKASAAATKTDKRKASIRINSKR